MNASDWVDAAESLLGQPSVPSALAMLLRAKVDLAPEDLRIVCDHLIGVWPDQVPN